MTNVTINISNSTILATPFDGIGALAGEQSLTQELQIAVDPEAIAAAIRATPRFTKLLADGARLPLGSDRTDHVAVIDEHTGLMWSVESLGSTKDEDDGISHEACKKRCAELNLLSFTDWRLPSRAELAGLIDDTTHEPAVDTNLFPRVKARWHWTSTPCAWSSASAWVVSFYYGLVNGNHRDGNGFALAVRRAGQ